MTTTRSELQPETINRLRLGVPLGYALMAGMDLDLFSALKDGPKTAAALAAALGADEDRLRALLYALAVAGLLSVKGDRFANGPEASEFLVQGMPRYMGHTHRTLSIVWGAAATTAESIRTGTAKSKIGWDTSDAQQIERALRSLMAGAVHDGRELAACSDFSAARSVADIGGGSGGLALGLTQVLPALHATVVELPRIATITQRIIAEAGANDRVAVQAIDVVREPPPGEFDAIVIRNVLQVLSPSDAASVVRNAGKAVKLGGAMYILGSILDNSRMSPPSEVAQNLFFLNVYEGGRAYTEQEYTEWLARAGFGSIKRGQLTRGAMISGHKPAD